MEINLKNCKNCLASKQEDSLVVGFCKPCISKAMSLLNEYYAIFHEERLINFPSLPHLQALHEND